MRILYIISHPDFSPYAQTGYGTHIRETIEGLRRRGHQVEICSANVGLIEDSSGKDQEQSIVENRYKTYLRSIIPALVWESIKDLKMWYLHYKFGIKVLKAIAECNPNVVYERACYMINPIVFYKGNITWIQEINAPFLEERVSFSGRSMLSGIANMIEKRALRRVNHIVVVSNALKQYLENSKKIRREKISVSHNGVSLKDFKRQYRKDEFTNEFVVGFVGSILPHHRIETLIEGFALFTEQEYDSRLVIVGDGEKMADYRLKAAELGLSSKIRFTGAVKKSEVANLIATMDVCIMPASNWYGSPVKIFEYGAMGKPVIAPDVGPVREIIEHRVEGLLVGNIDEMVEAMKSLRANKELALSMADRFYSKINKHFTWEANTERLEYVIRMTLDEDKIE